MSDSQPAVGGPEWESGEAWKMIIQARADGDVEAERLGWLRYKEALVNAAGSTAGAVLKPLAAKLDALIVEVKHSRDDVEHYRSDDKLWRKEERERQSKSSTYIHTEMETLISLAREGQAAIKKLETRVGRLEEDHDVIRKLLEARPAQRLKEHQEIVNEFDQRFTMFEVAFAKLSASLALSEDAVIVIDRDQRITWTSLEALEMFGYSADELIGRPLDMLLPERFRAAHRRHVEMFARSDIPTRRMAERSAVYGLHKDGTEFPIRAAISKVPDGFTAVVRRV